MSQIKFEVEDSYIKNLRQILSLKDNIDALTLLNWAADEHYSKRILVSTDLNGNNVKRLAMRSLDNIKPL